MRSIIFVALLILGAPHHIATADVIDSDKHGFTLVNEVVVDATRAEAWSAAVDDVAQWWNPDHTISGNADCSASIRGRSVVFASPPATALYI